MPHRVNEHLHHDETDPEDSIMLTVIPAAIGAAMVFPLLVPVAVAAVVSGVNYFFGVAVEGKDKEGAFKDASLGKSLLGGAAGGAIGEALKK